MNFKDLINDFNRQTLQDANAWQKDYYPHLRGNKEKTEEKKKNVDELYVLYKIIRQGDTIYNVTARFNLDITKMKRINNYKDDARIYNIGDYLKLPVKKYVIKKGQGIKAILRNSRMNDDENSEDFSLFLHINNISTDSLILPGQEVLVLDKDIEINKPNVIHPKYDNRGYYYSEDGAFLYAGNGTNTNDNVYVVEFDGNKKIMKHKNIEIKYGLFEELAGWAYNENTINGFAQKASLGMLNNWTNSQNHNWTGSIHTLRQAIDTIYGHHNGKNSSTFVNQRKFINTSPKDRNTQIGMKSAVQSLIYMLLDGRDLSFGSVQEHGRDFFTDLPLADSKQYSVDFFNSNKPIIINIGETMNRARRAALDYGWKWSSNGLFHGEYTPITNPSQKGRMAQSERQRFQGYEYAFLIMASYDGNIFAKFIDMP